MDQSTAFPPHEIVHHEAMKTTFSLRLCGEDKTLLHSLAGECISRIDELESKLSRYHDGGDISRINNLKSGETLHISTECHECLLQAIEVSIHTGGLFDPTLGTVIEHKKTSQKGAAPSITGQLSIHPDSPAVTCLEEGRVLDLGGIGKGFTLDQLAKYLGEWDITGALLSAGASTHLAIGEHAWPIDLAGESNHLRVNLKNQAISASGTTIQGSHIVSPDPDRELTDSAPTRIWASSPSASFSDAWSTALILMSPDETQHAPSLERKLSAVYWERDGELSGVFPE